MWHLQRGKRVMADQIIDHDTGEVISSRRTGITAERMRGRGDCACCCQLEVQVVEVCIGDLKFRLCQSCVAMLNHVIQDICYL